jgi:amino acid transporter
MIDKEEQEEQEEPLVDKEKKKAKKKIILIILTIIGVLVTIGAIIFIVFITKEKYDDTDNKKNDQKEFDYGLTLTELQDRTNSEHLGKFIFLKQNSEEYTKLPDGDKKALKYLVKAAMIMDEIALRLDNIHNIPFKKFLESELKNNKKL